MTTDCSLITDFSTRKIQVQNMLCTNFLFCFDIQNNICTQHVLNLYFSCCNSMSNISLYCGLTDSRMRASDIDLPVLVNCFVICFYLSLHCYFYSHFFTGKSMSEALTLESVNPQYDERLFIEFQEKYKFTTCCNKYCFFVFVLTLKTILVHNMFWTCIFLGIQWTISRHIGG